MNTKVVTISVIFIGVILVGFLGISYVSAYNLGNRMEAQLKAAYDNNQNILSQYSQRVAEAAQVPAMQRDDLTQVIESALSARYGEEGSQATFQWIQEQNPTIDSAVYLQIQRIIESGRNDFQDAQTKMIDIKRSYETQLGSFWTGTWMSVAGYPKVDLDEYKVIVTSRTLDVYQNGVESEPLRLR